MSVDVAILCAGNSSRLGHPKQHVDLRNRPLLINALEIATQFHNRQSSNILPLLVTGAYSEDDQQVVSDQPIEVVRNEQWRDGLSSSIASAVGARRESTAVLLMLVDQYRITLNDLWQLWVRWQEHPQSPIASVYGEIAGKDAVGPPIIWPSRYFERLRSLKGTGKRLLQSLDYQRVELDNALYDLDTADDLLALRQYEATLSEDRRSDRNDGGVAVT